MEPVNTRAVGESGQLRGLRPLVFAWPSGYLEWTLIRQAFLPLELQRVLVFPPLNILSFQLAKGESAFGFAIEMNFIRKQDLQLRWISLANKTSNFAGQRIHSGYATSQNNRLRLSKANMVRWIDWFFSNVFFEKFCLRFFYPCLWVVGSTHKWNLCKVLYERHTISCVKNGSYTLYMFHEHFKFFDVF